MKCIKLNKVQQPKAKLYLFSHAGGSSLNFQSWRRGIPETSIFDIQAIELPNRIYPFDFNDTTLEEYLQEISSFIHEDADMLPVGLFGQSMGGLMAFEIARILEAVKDSMVCWVGIANCSPLILKNKFNAHRRGKHTYSDEELIQYLISLDYEQGSFFQNPEFRESFLPVVRKDLELLDSYKSKSETAIILANLSIFLGNQDKTLNLNEMSLWRYKTRGEYEMLIYEAGHNLLKGTEQTYLKSDVFRLFSQSFQAYTGNRLQNIY
ncbi:hypothetical protein GC101_08530 [Paenibacillus sp. LMG 31459]|uniref:Thioesterase domain-containing protein n=1 Tax=Paenibacillus phytohabitans TaxID=2654978 RepID=A0ABX1YG15_9BACL|nr:thioesterase [Paenibacillus phytohabitans]NOU78931.1 hypothetical protein [Paenibacillus phytohabitans]